MEFSSAARFAVVATLPVSGTQGDSLVLSSDGHLYTYNGSSWVDNGAAGGAGTFGSMEFNAGSKPVRSGRFTITDAAISPASTVIVTLAAGPYTGKGTLADEAQMYPGITFPAVPGSGSAVVYWSAPYGSAARGFIKVNYQVG